jgi:uncharacterized phage-like protein YoqJ
LKKTLQTSAHFEGLHKTKQNQILTAFDQHQENWEVNKQHKVSISSYPNYFSKNTAHAQAIPTL